MNQAATVGGARMQNLHLLIDHFRPWGPALRKIAALSVVAAVLDVLVLVAIAPLLGSVAGGANEISGTLWGRELEISFGALVVLTGTLVVVRAAVALLAKTVEARLLARYEADMRSDCLRSFVEASWELQSSERSGRLQQYLGGHIGRSQTALRSLSIGVSELLGLVALLSGAVLVGGPAVLLAIVVLVAIGQLLRPFQRISREASREQAELGPHWTAQIAETTALVRETRMLGVTEVELGRTASTIERMRALREREQDFTNGAPVIYEATGLIVVLAGLLAIKLVEPDNLTAIGAAALLLIRALLRGRNLQNQYQTVNNLTPFVEDLDRQLRVYEAAAEEDGTIDLGPIESIALRELDFQYGDGEPVLAELNVEIVVGEALGIIGPSGAGKSTLLELLLRLRRPTDGSIELNGIDIRAYTASTLYRRVRFVPQDPLLFDASVRDNVTAFSDAADGEVWAALRAVGLDQEIVAMGGLDAPVGSLGGQLSGGQRQRMAIARALIAHPDVLILDEPTAALDAHSESTVQQSLRELPAGVTLIVVAHRLSTLEACDRILVLTAGRVRAHGRREELQQSNEYYRDALRLSGLR